jgi:hypothetical protein
MPLCNGLAEAGDTALSAIPFAADHFCVVTPGEERPQSPGLT